MGISGLLPFLKNATRPVNLKEFSGCTIAIDVYCWLHKGAFGCAEQLVRGQFTDGYIKYVMKYVNMLLYHNIKPILVFDGRNLPSKSETEKKRRTARKENKERAVKLLAEGKRDQAREFFQRCVDITPAMAREVIAAARERNIDCIVAPYEADAQLAFLNLCGLAQLVITEDSDLTLFGCSQILFKLKETGEAIYYNRSDLGKVFGSGANNFSFEKFRYMCIMAGCDYVSSLPGIGLVKAKNFWNKVTNPDLNNVLRKIPAYLNMPQLIVSHEYIARFIQANQTFLHQLVFDPVRREEVPLTPLPSALPDLPSFCGSYSGTKIALQLALGNMDIHSMAQVSYYNPDFPPVHDIKSKSNYGERTKHPSVWSSTSSSGSVASAPLPKDEMIAMAQKPTHPVKERKVVAVVNRVEKRKPEKAVISEQNIAELLNEDSPSSPQVKRPRLQGQAVSAKKLFSMLGETEAKPGVVTVSKYFPTQTNTKEQAVIADKRRSSVSTEESGSWFSGLEKPSSAEGKFIYRAQLEDITNGGESSGSNKEVLLSTPRRNPFAVKKKFAAEVSTVDLTAVTKCESPVRDKSMSDSGVSSMPSSQLSNFSLDGDSVIFSDSSGLVPSQEPNYSQTSCSGDETVVPCVTSVTESSEGVTSPVMESVDIVTLNVSSSVSPMTVSNDSNVTISDSFVTTRVNPVTAITSQITSNVKSTVNCHQGKSLGLSKFVFKRKVPSEEKNLAEKETINSSRAASPSTVSPVSASYIPTSNTTSMTTSSSCSSKSPTSFLSPPAPVSKLGPARVSGLSRTNKPSSTNLGPLKQGSLLDMFSRKPKKADLGGS